MSNSAKPNEFARQLLSYEVVAGGSVDAKKYAVLSVCEKLQGPLSRLVGTGGFRSLLSSALALSGEGTPWLRALHVKSDGSLVGLNDLENKPDSHTLAEGEAALISQLLGLLITFIGPSMTLQLLQEAWPKLHEQSF